MAKNQGGLGKTARSSNDAAKKAAARAKLTGHVCPLCTERISQGDLLIVKGDKTVAYHFGCYESQVERPKGPNGASNHPEVKNKQVAGIPNTFLGRRGWANRTAGHMAGYDRRYGFGHLA